MCNSTARCRCVGDSVEHDEIVDRCVATFDADSEEKREPASDINTAEVDSLKVLDPEWPIREVDIMYAPGADLVGTFA